MIRKLGLASFIVFCCFHLTGCPNCDSQIYSTDSSTTVDGSGFDGSGFDNSYTEDPGNCSDLPPFYLPPVNPNTISFTVDTAVVEPATMLTIPEPGVLFSGQWMSDSPGATGELYTVLDTTGPNGLSTVYGARVPATWNFDWLKDNGIGKICNTEAQLQLVTPGDVVFMYCFITVDTPEADIGTLRDQGPIVPLPKPVLPVPVGSAYCSNTVHVSIYSNCGE